ncbi:MAG: tRNA pseudouridine(55) synthase TruB [Clostridiales bacterium]|nr:tRNA pseudouridine(55) synthase TruB [Clostridiales bacterium]
MDGILVINKDKNCTSHDVVYKIKKIFNEKVGHTGTLDPNATGVLPILIGKGTQLSKYLINHDKKYIATLQLGIKTDTADIEGNVIDKQDINMDCISESIINNIFQSIVGKQIQTPPIYSAIKVKGKKLYEYARSGKSVDIPKREIEIYSLNLIKINREEKSIEFEVHCSKGTYIRSLCESIAEKLGTIGYMADLQRTMAGEFLIENSIDIVDLDNNKHDIQFLNEHIITIESFFKNNSKIILNSKKLDLLLNGVILDCTVNDTIVRIYDEKNNFIGIATINNGKMKRDIII